MMLWECRYKWQQKILSKSTQRFSQVQCPTRVRDTFTWEITCLTCTGADSSKVQVFSLVLCDMNCASAFGASIVINQMVNNKVPFSLCTRMGDDKVEKKAAVAKNEYYQQQEAGFMHTPANRWWRTYNGLALHIMILHMVELGQTVWTRRCKVLSSTSSL